IGVGEADLPRLFEWFRRAETALVHKIRGTGIGLASVKRIVEQHGGTVGVRSVAGQGSTFELLLPCAPP
ncbi:MAG: hybrid sensor histidine kinase/response regulator, partial [Myxococcaceae bacterium]|nr:hybrid sensor histidine kinase/response regulator [Myxococcaceae bacterium]